MFKHYKTLQSPKKNNEGLKPKHDTEALLKERKTRRVCMFTVSSERRFTSASVA